MRILIILLLLSFTCLAQNRKLSGKAQNGTYGYRDSTGKVRNVVVFLPAYLSDSAFQANPDLWTTRMKIFNDSNKLKYHR